MFDPIFNPKITILHQNAMRIFINSITDHITPNVVTAYAYRVGAECLHVLKLDDQLEITIVDGKNDIPNKENCLDYLRTGHIQIGVFDSMDVTYTINSLLNTFKEKNERLICSFLQHDEQ